MAWNLRDGIFKGVYRQQAGRAFLPQKIEKTILTALLPSRLASEELLGAVTAKEGAWPMEVPLQRRLVRPIQSRDFQKAQETYCREVYGGC